jgi:mRNA interferase MazF
MTGDYQWSIFQADLDPTVGREQVGERPVLVVSAEPLNKHYDVVMVAPITSRKNGRQARVGEVLLKAGTGGLRVESFALCYQVRTLDKSRLSRKCGVIDDPIVLDEIQSVLSLCLDLE